jgi:hypothetical protein
VNGKHHAPADYPREITLVSFEVEAGWVPDPV